MRTVLRAVVVNTLWGIGAFLIGTAIMLLLRGNGLPYPEFPDWVWGL